MVLVEYCRFGSLRTFLQKHRGDFVNLLNSSSAGSWNSMNKQRQQQNKIDNALIHSQQQKDA
jgi:hypothetical protein